MSRPPHTVARAVLGLLALVGPFILMAFIALLVFTSISGFWATLGMTLLGLLSVASIGVWAFLGFLAHGLKWWARRSWTLPTTRHIARSPAN
ncbi:hypothetical protein ACIRST_09010 [Kitasatospora sp. NPDC101447]|uniref:hypothetical protein n=1 Tax=Kitasatospora sp. NPDC101447 TaxID=3364102 RepID=UPI0037F62619